MKNTKLNFHIFETCNMNCQFCFRRKDIFKLNDKWKEAIDLIASDGKINYLNIAGGEPTINKNLLIEILEYIKSKNLKSSIITNGLILANDKEYLNQVLTYVDTIGVSVDSLDEKICKLIGRVDCNGQWLTKSKLEFLNKQTKTKGKKFKINIVLSEFNINDKSLDYINKLDVDRIKILRNQNDNQIKENDLINFKKNFDKCKDIVIEYDMDHIYLMLDGNLCLSTTRNEVTKSIFKPNSLQNAIESLKKD